NVFIVEVDVAVKAEHAGVPVGPLVHLAEFDIANDVVDAKDAAVTSRRVLRFEAGEEWPGIVLEGNERMDGIAVGLDGRATYAAVPVCCGSRFFDGLGSAAH